MPDYSDPISKARKLSAPELLKKFYKQAELIKNNGEYILALDGRQANTPGRNKIRVRLKYGPDGVKVISEIKRVSRPGCRVYRGVSDLKPFMNGLGIYVVSTPRGVLSDRECRSGRVGGEVLCSVW